MYYEPLGCQDDVKAWLNRALLEEAASVERAVHVTFRHAADQRQLCPGCQAGDRLRTIAARL